MSSDVTNALNENLQRFGPSKLHTVTTVLYPPRPKVMYIKPGIGSAADDPSDKSVTYLESGTRLDCHQLGPGAVSDLRLHVPMRIIEAMNPKLQSRR